MKKIWDGTTGIGFADMGTNHKRVWEIGAAAEEKNTR